MTWRAIALAVALGFCFPAAADEPPQDSVENILAIRLDGKEVIGTAIIKQSADGDVWLDVVDWKTMTGVELDLVGKTGLVSAKSLGLIPEFDAAAQAVNLKVPATSRPDQRLGRKRVRLTKVNSQPIGALINYDLAGRVHEDGAYNASLGHEVRIGVGPATLVSLGQLNHTSSGTTYRRGLTTLNYDHLKSGTAVQLGDVFTPRTNLGSNVNLGGVRIASDRALRRDESFLPVPTLGGVVHNASTAEIFINGNKTSQHSIKPGPWQVDEYPVLPGTNSVQVVVRDDFGREQVLEDTFYLAPGNLPRGTTEWEVAAGLVRKSGDDYQRPAVAAKIERGMTHNWTVGGAIQATQEAKNLSLSNRVVLGRAGALSIDMATSQSPQGSGHALAVSYDYKGRDWSVHTGHSSYSDDYWTLADERLPSMFSNGRSLESTTALALSFNPKGKSWSAGIGAASMTYHDGTTRSRLDASMRYRQQQNEFGFGVSFSPDQEGAGAFATWRHTFSSGTSLNVTARKAPDIQGELRLTGRNVVAGKEVRWSAGVELDRRGESAWAQGSVGTSKGVATLSAQYANDNSQITGRFQGSVWVGEGGVAFQRPSPGSFLVVEVEGQKGVPVAAGGGFVGKTNGGGVAVIPNVQALVNHQVSINGQDLPLDVGLETTIQPASVGRRAGGKVEFTVLSSTMQEIHLTIDGQDLAPPAAVVSDTEEAVIGEGGVAVLMKPVAGQRLTVEHAEGACTATLPDILPGYETIVDLECKENP